MSGNETIVMKQNEQPSNNLGSVETITTTTELSNTEMAKVIAASTVGTTIEWYDFFVYGSLSTVLAQQFYRTGTPSGDLIVFLGSYAVGFIVRPFGAVVFGAIGDFIGRKYTFALTLIMMGLCTFLIGCVPTLEGSYSIGVTSGYILIFLRIVQGLAIGGEYGGAATYVAEHSVHGKRGFYTSFIQISAVLGLFLSLLVIIIVRLACGEAAFVSWGWRICFWLSGFLVVGALYIRLKMNESPLFLKVKESGKGSQSAWNALVMSFGNRYNLGYVALALFGATMGQGVVFYTSQFYPLTFIQSTLKTPLISSYMIVGIPLLLASPLYVLFGYLSDRYGRKKFMLLGMFLASATYYPLFMGLHYYRPYVDPTAKPLVSSDNYSPFMMSLFIFIMATYSALCYGPIAAFLVELFPTSIRYTSLSLPYHIGNGVFGGLVPVIGVTVAKVTGNIFGGLYYPIGIIAISFIVGLIFLPETNEVDISVDTPKEGENAGSPKN
ncbi:major facilitator superfamily domain-containing protein [Globomyces pollinis-pini]|nr:major facilitator superfamily domain-containing protein [Globomyces pollinis-pini]